MHSISTFVRSSHLCVWLFGGLRPDDVEMIKMSFLLYIFLLACVETCEDEGATLILTKIECDIYFLFPWFKKLLLRVNPNLNKKYWHDGYLWECVKKFSSNTSLQWLSWNIQTGEQISCAISYFMCSIYLFFSPRGEMLHAS